MGLGILKAHINNTVGAKTNKKYVTDHIKQAGILWQDLICMPD